MVQILLFLIIQQLVEVMVEIILHNRVLEVVVLVEEHQET
jgi:hypothetical protein